MCVCVLMALVSFAQFVWNQQVLKSRLKQMQRYHEVTLLKNTFVAWKVHQHFVITSFRNVGETTMMLQLMQCGLLHSQEHHLQVRQVYGHAEELYRRQEQNFLRY